MAEVVESYRFKSERTKIDWAKYLDGQTWFLEFGVDIDSETSAESFRTKAYQAAKRLGVKLRINKSRKTAKRAGYYVQAILRETESC
jgi:hypothetical protein